MEDPDQEGMIHHSGKLRNQDQDIDTVGPRLLRFRLSISILAKLGIFFRVTIE